MQTNLTVDAGLVLIDAMPVDDMVMTCADEAVTLDVLANDTDGANLTVTEVNGTDIAEGETIVIDGVEISLVGGELVFNGTTALADLEIGQEETRSYTYTAETPQGGEGTANVDVTFCGALNTVDTIASEIPTTGDFSIKTFNLSNAINAYTGVLSNTGDARLDGIEIEAAYCIDSALPFLANIETQADISVATEANALSAGLSSTAAGNIDLVNWIINQDFTSQDNGDGNGKNFTDAEVQDAIWTMLNGDTFFLNNSFFGNAFNDNDNGVRDGSERVTAENIDDIVQAALTSAEAEGYEPGEGDLLGLIINPVDPDEPGQEQPFIVAVSFDDFAVDCIC